MLADNMKTAATTAFRHIPEAHQSARGNRERPVRCECAQKRFGGQMILPRSQSLPSPTRDFEPHHPARQEGPPEIVVTIGTPVLNKEPCVRGPHQTSLPQHDSPRKQREMTSECAGSPRRTPKLDRIKLRRQSQAVVIDRATSKQSSRGAS